MFLNHLFDSFLGILTAGKQILIRQGHIGQGLSVFPHSRNINHPADIYAAVADKNTDTGVLFGDIDFIGDFNRFGFGSPGFDQIGCPLHRPPHWLR